MHTEIESLAEFDAVAATGSLRECVVQGLDLGDRLDVLARVEVRGALFLGCGLPLAAAQQLGERHAVVFPRLPQVPFDAYRAHLYTADELYAGLERGYPHTPDGAIHAWATRPSSLLLDGALARALHDHAVADALEEALVDHPSGVGIMGGHAARRGTPTYLAAARLGQLLAAAGHLVVTGGGPGAMEAANLGAALAGDVSAVDAACADLAAVPDFHDSVEAWASLALAVRDEYGPGRPGLGIPTWHYGHEPPNVFATAIAKYFDNALREDAIIRHCTGGIVFVAGAAGTTQEIFQAVTRNYYAADAGEVRPLVLVGRAYWTEVLPAWQLLSSLARGRLMEPFVHLVDDLEEVPAVLA